jgi:hypothetical protein
MKCICCDDVDMSFQWSDTHGVGVCCRCGMPYRMIHYEGPEGDQKRVEKPPECVILEAWQVVGKRYWQETGKRVFPADFDMGFRERDGRSYSGATESERRSFWKWVDDHKDEMPKAKEK